MNFYMQVKQTGKENKPEATGVCYSQQLKKILIHNMLHFYSNSIQTVTQSIN